jgi:hypothetical protein
MIKKYSFYVLFLIILLISAAFVFDNFYKNSNNNINLDKLFLTNLNANNAIDQVKRIKIDFNGETFTLLEDSDGKWVVLEKNKYPVNEQKVKELVFDLANLKVLEAKTAKSENFAALQLEDIEINKNSTQIILSDINNQEIDSIYIGKREFVASTNADYQANIFVRKPKENKVWLVAGKLAEEFSFKNLVKQPIISLDLANVLQLELGKVNQPSKNFIKIERDPNTKILNLLDISPRYKLKEQYVIDNIVQQFAYLNYEDVVLNNVDAVPVLHGKVVTANDNINFELVYLNKNYYLKLDNNWLYKISDYACQSLLINKADLLTEIVKKPKKQ